MSPPPGGATADQIRTKLGSVGGPLDVITHTCFELNRLRAVSVAWGSVSHASTTSTIAINIGAPCRAAL